MKKTRNKYVLRLLLGTDFHEQALHELRTLCTQDELEKWMALSQKEVREDEETEFFVEVQKMIRAGLHSHESVYQEVLNHNRRYGGYTEKRHVDWCFIGKALAENPDLHEKALELVRTVGLPQDYPNLIDYCQERHEFWMDFGPSNHLLCVAHGHGSSGCPVEAR